MSAREERCGPLSWLPYGPRDATLLVNLRRRMQPQTAHLRDEQEVRGYFQYPECVGDADRRHYRAGAGRRSRTDQESGGVVRGEWRAGRAGRDQYDRGVIQFLEGQLPA